MNISFIITLFCIITFIIYFKISKNNLIKNNIAIYYDLSSYVILFIILGHISKYIINNYGKETNVRHTLFILMFLFIIFINYSINIIFRTKYGNKSNVMDFSDLPLFNGLLGCFTFGYTDSTLLP